MMALGNIKEMLLAMKEEKIIQLTIDPLEMIVLVNYAWELLFVCCIKNKNTIMDRGLYTPNCVLLPKYMK